MKENDLASDSRLFIFSDGPKDNEKSREGVAKVREYISSVDGFASVDVIARESNYGCARNIVEGITQIVNEFGRVIVVEDDILTSRYFLRYMNDALELYKDDNKAGAVSAYIQPMYVNKGLPQSFFSHDVGLWGWGTWQRVWKDYEFDAGILLEKIRKAGLEEKFNYGLKLKPCTRELTSVAADGVDTWDFQVKGSLFLHGRYVLKPCKPFSNNIGFDGTGLHCGTTDYNKVNAVLAEEYTPLERIPVELNMLADKLYYRAMVRSYSIPYRTLRKIWRMVKSLVHKVSKS